MCNRTFLGYVLCSLTGLGTLGIKIWPHLHHSITNSLQCRHIFWVSECAIFDLKAEEDWGE